MESIGERRRVMNRKAMERTFARQIRKHRLWTLSKYAVVWNSVCEGQKIGNAVLFVINPTAREKRRIKGALPEIIAALKRTAIASRSRGKYVVDRQFVRFGFPETIEF